MQRDNFLARFLTAQQAKGSDLGPLYGTLERIASGHAQDDSPAAMWPAVRGGAAPEPTPQPEAQRPAWLVTPEELDDLEAQRPRTVQEIQAELAARRPAPEPEAPPVDYREKLAQAIPQFSLPFHFAPVDTLTACMDSAECPATARKIYRLLFELALHTVRVRGLPEKPTVGVFHLPLDLLAGHFEIDRTTVYRNIQPLIRAGVLDCRDHYGDLKGHTAVTGKVWAVSLEPERVLSGELKPVRLRLADLRFPWRDLTRDVQDGRTAYAATRTPERQERDKAQREARAEQDAQARARAEERRKEREAAQARGEKVPTGRAAATANAAQTRAEKPRPTRPKAKMQQSREGLKAVEKSELILWVLAPFQTQKDVNLTVAGAFADGLDAVFSLPSLAALPKADRNAAVEKVARSLAATFEDSENLRFWCWLVWQTLRAQAQGQDYTEDVAHILMRVLHDVKHDETMNTRTMNNPAALVVNALRNCGILDALRELKRYRVGGMPRPAA